MRFFPGIPGSGLRPGNAYRTRADLVGRCVMKRFVVFLVVVLSAAAMLGAFPAIVGADQAVPFKGRAELTRTGLQVLPDGTVLLTFVGTGNSTHLGRFIEEASVVVHGDGSFSATVVLTAANGDQVFKSAVGASVSVGTFTVNGGTGRFRNATGSGVVMHASSDGFAHVDQTYEGTIQFYRVVGPWHSPRRRWGGWGGCEPLD